MSGRGVISLNIQELCKLLQLPDSFSPLSVYYEHDRENVCMVVEHPDIDRYGDYLAVVTPVYTQLKDGTVKLTDIKTSGM